MPIEIFDGRDVAHDDAAYRRWLGNHPVGYLLNTRRGINPNLMSLHRPGCRQISGLKANDAPGAFTERQYAKICADSVQELRDWVRVHGRPNGDFTSEGCGCLR